MTSVSVIVVCRNEVSCIQRLVDNILAQDATDLKCELLVADGMSDDGTREVLDRIVRSNHIMRMRIIDNPGKIVSTGLNAALGVASGEVIIRLDAHTEYAPDYIQNCVRILRETGAANVGGPWQARARGYVGNAIAAGFRSRFCVGPGRAHDVQYEGPLDTVYLGCWPRSVFDRIGLFDPTLIRNQDDEFNLRLTRAGGTVWQSPRIISWYQPRESLGKLFHQYFQYGFWKVAVIRKHGTPASWRHLAPGIFVLVNLILPLVTLLGLVSDATHLMRSSAMLWASQAVTYVVMSLAAAACAASRQQWRLFPLLPLVFFTYHVAYGTGFMIGIVCSAVCPNHTRKMLPTLFCGLSR